MVVGANSKAYLGGSSPLWSLFSKMYAFYSESVWPTAFVYASMYAFYVFLYAKNLATLTNSYIAIYLTLI